MIASYLIENISKNTWKRISITTTTPSATYPNLYLQTSFSPAYCGWTISAPIKGNSLLCSKLITLYLLKNLSQQIFPSLLHHQFYLHFSKSSDKFWFSPHLIYQQHLTNRSPCSLHFVPDLATISSCSHCFSPGPVTIHLLWQCMLKSVRTQSPPW